MIKDDYYLILADTWKSFIKTPSALSFHRFESKQSSIDFHKLSEELKQFSSVFPEGVLKQRYFTIPSFSSPKRALEWSQSRHSLIDVVHQLKFKNIDLSKIILSLSHTTQATVVIGSVKTPEIIGIGVDLEYSTREVTSRAGKSFQFPEEECWTSLLSSLEFWIIKEACYKANPDNKMTVIADYRILNFDAHFRRGQVGNIKNLHQIFQFQLAPKGEFSCAFAFLNSP